MEEVKSYINTMTDIQRKINENGPIASISEAYKINFGGEYHILTLAYPDIYFGYMWIVEYKFLDGILLNPEGKCVRGAAIHTDIENKYPKFSKEKIKEYYKNALEKFEKEKLNVQRSTLDEGGIMP